MNIGIEDGAVASAVKLGLTQNWRQFALLLLVNAFVGCMVSIERTVVQLIGSEDFHVASTTLGTAFIVSFELMAACLRPSIPPFGADRRS